MSTPTVWSHRSDHGAKFIYNAAKDSYQIWLDSPGRVEEQCGHEDIKVIAEGPGFYSQNSIDLAKKPSEVEFDGERYSLQEWFASKGVIEEEPVAVGIVDKGFAGPEAHGLFEVETNMAGAEIPKKRYQVTMEVECYDITQVMSEVYRGQNALIQEVAQ